MAGKSNARHLRRRQQVGATSTRRRLRDWKGLSMPCQQAHGELFRGHAFCRSYACEEAGCSQAVDEQGGGEEARAEEDAAGRLGEADTFGRD
jgi:hypothetical protein